MPEFLKLISATEARAALRRFDPVGTETVSLSTAGRRVAAEAILAPTPSPPWPRAVMDGYAVRATDTHGASDAAPAYLSVTGTVPMGEVWKGRVGAGEAVGISTGGAMPDGADAVVMVEYTQESPDGQLEVHRGVAQGDNCIATGDDMKAGDLLIPTGTRLRPQDIAVLSSFGILEVPVFCRPRVGILSTGNEIVSPDVTPPPGKIRCMNQQGLAEQVRRAGGEPVLGGIAPDDVDAIRAGVEKLVQECDMVLLSGGSSVGVRDLTARVLEDLGAEMVFHGISVRPGKPNILARLGDRPVVGMPGVPLSAMVIFDAFIRPLLWRMEGEEERDPWPSRRIARMSRRMASVPGREDYLRVRVEKGEEGLLAVPLLGGSSMTSTLIRASGFVVVPAGAEGIEEGETVEVLLFE